MKNQKLHVITGGPGVGKTSLLNYLDSRGFTSVPEDIQDDLNMLVKLHPYQSKVFILPPWEEIYETDDERKQTWEEAVFTFEKMKETYLEFGYDIIEVPKCGVEGRARFVLDCI